jgi:excisionase family DNA binding protein
MNPTRQAAVRAAVDALVAALVDAVDSAAPTEDQPDRLLSIDQAAATLGVGRTAVYALMDSRRLRNLKVGSRRLIPAEALRDFIAGQAG